MPVCQLDTLGLKCPQPVLKLALQASQMRSGDILEVLGDCPTFERDVRKWCERLNKPLLAVNDNGNGSKAKKIQVQF